MENARVQKVSLSEIHQARHDEGYNSFPAISFSNDKNIPESLSLEGVQTSFNDNSKISTSHYIGILKKDESLIRSWFKPFGYRSHEHLGDKIFVDCQNFDVLFDDYNLVMNEKTSTLNDKEAEQNELLQATLSDLDTNLAEVLEEYVTTKLSDRFPSYGETRRKFKLGAYDRAYKRFNNNSEDSALKSIIFEQRDKQKAVANLVATRSYFGSYTAGDDENK